VRDGIQENGFVMEVCKIHVCCTNEYHEHGVSQVATFSQFVSCIL